MSGPWIVVVTILWAVVLCLLLLFLGYFRRTSKLLEQAEFQLSLATTAQGGLGGLQAGAKVLPFRVENTNGSLVGSETLLSEPSIVLFMDENCDPCQALASELQRSNLSGIARILILADGAVDDSLAADRRVYRQVNRSASRAFQSVSSPQAFAVATGGIIVDRLVPDSVRDLEELWRLVGEEVRQ